MPFELSGEWDNFFNDARTVDWRFNYEDEKWRCEAEETKENQIDKEEENHYYHKENSPSGANFFASYPSRNIFVDEEGIDKDKNVAWRFNFGDQGFRNRALTVPSCVHVKELEFHEYHKKNAKFDQKNYVMTKKPAPILKPVDCMKDTCDPCAPPIKMTPPSCPCLPPLPPHPCCIPYPNALSEKEWHNIRKEVASLENSYDQNESALYQRDVKTCDPCMLPQLGLKGRFYKKPPIEKVKNTFNPADPGKTKEDEGECGKRETRGPGIYPYKGWLPSAPLCMPGDVPCGYYFNEQQAHTYCTSGGGGVAGDDRPKPKAPPPPPCPPKVKCPNPMPCYPCPKPPAIVCCSPCCGPC